MKQLARFAVFVSFVAVLSLLILYVTHFGRADFGSDDAVLSMLAESIAQQGTPFPQGWVSNNGDLMLPSGALILAPLLAWFPNGFHLHAVAGVFAVALMLLSFSGFLKSARVPTLIILLATTVLATGPSRLFVLMLYQQTTYVWLSAGFFLSATLVWKRHSDRDAQRTTGWAGLCVLAMIIFLLAFSNPGRALFMLVIPIYVFDRALALQSMRKTSGIRRITVSLGLKDSSVLMGLAFPSLLAAALYYGMFHFGFVETVHNASNLYWDGVGSLRTHADVFFRNWIPSLGGGREAMASDVPLERFLRTFRHLFAIWLTWVGFAEVVRLRVSRNRLRTALTLAWLAALIPSLFMFIAFAPLAIDASTMRYFTIPILLLLAMAALRLASASAWWVRIAPATAILMSIFLVAVAGARFVPAMTNPSMHFLQARTSSPMRLAQLLVDENLQWGYATWWNAGVTTVLSEAKVRVSPVFKSDSGMLPFTCMIQRDWYQSKTWNGETFLALSRSEATAEALSFLEMSIGPETRKINSPEYTVLVYEWNIATNFSCDQASVTNLPLESNQLLGDILAVKSASHSPLKPDDVVGVLIRNRGSQPLAGRGEAPIAMRFEWMAGAESEPTSLTEDIALPCAIGAGETRAIQVKLPESPDRANKLRISLTQQLPGGSRELDGAGVEVPFRARPSPIIFQGGFEHPRRNE